jgi:PKD domain/Immune inhibitor A-like, MAM domain/IPT/TIG domain
MRNRLIFIVTMTVLLVGVVFAAKGDGGVARAEAGLKNNSSVQGVTVIGPISPTISPAVRDLPPYVEVSGPEREVNPHRTYDRGLLSNPRGVSGIDPLLVNQSTAPTANSLDGFSTPIVNINGHGYTFVTPPDTVGDVGSNHFIQMVNGSSTMVTIYDKAGNIVFGPFPLDSLGNGVCSSGYGDPIVLYDQQADRWLLSEFAGSGNNLCVYISTTSDPTGTYYGYIFPTPDFPDYPKYAVWPDAYYVTTNESDPTVYALDRARMLAGLSATMQRFTAPPLSGFPFQALTPADLDGATLPPAGTPGIMMRHRDTEVHGPSGYPTQDILEIWQFHVDWNNPGNSSFTGPINIFTSEFDSDLCGLSNFYCFPQPGTPTTLDPLREVIMWRLSFRNFGIYQTLVGNFVTDVNGNDHGGVRWFELRKEGDDPWILNQEGTVAPDAEHRWMGAIAMDGSGDIALGYNVSSTTVYPSLRYIGRLRTDPLGTMPQGEYSLVEGTDYNQSNRYGDYSAMSVDPVDDCTFWFTGEYDAGPNHQWSTRIGAFKFDSCTGSLGPDFTLLADPESQSVCAPADAQYGLTIGSVMGFSDPVTLNAIGYPGGSTANFEVNPVTPPGTSNLTIGNTGEAIAGSYNIDIVGIAPTTTHTLTVGLNLYSDVPSVPTLLLPADGAVDVPQRPIFDWGDLPLTNGYNLEVSLSPLFESPILTATRLTSSDYAVTSPLEGGKCYWWQVQGSNTCGVGEWSDPFHFATVVLTTTFYDDIESGAGNWSHAVGQGTDHWVISTAQSHSPTHSWFVPDDSSLTDTRLWTTYPITVGAGSTLTFWHQYQFEGASYDGSVLEISTNGGGTWTDLGAYITSNGYNGTIDTSYSNPLGGREGWTGDLTSWTQVSVDLNSFAGQSVMVRWRLGCDTSVGDVGWYIDDVEITAPLPPNPSPVLVSITPNSGFSNTQTPVVIEGTGFTGTPSLKLGDTWLISTTLVSSTTIDAVVPAGMEAGVYDLVLYNGDCQTKTLASAFTVIAEEVPIAGLVATNDSPTLLGDPTFLTATITAGTNVEFVWDFGDGITMTGQVVSHTYSAAGTYTATITATNSVSSAQETTTVEVYVIPIENYYYLPVVNKH